MEASKHVLILKFLFVEHTAIKMENEEKVLCLVVCIIRNCMRNCSFEQHVRFCDCNNTIL